VAGEQLLEVVGVILRLALGEKGTDLFSADIVRQ
tara:strand:+ start:8046 stop:8147 length:102 start_codon:yes stop_codon:yes gene_type:complete